MAVSQADQVRLEAALASGLPALLAEVATGLRQDWPDYADFLDSNRGDVAEAATLFIRRLVQMTDQESSPDVGAAFRRSGNETVHLVFEQIGRQQFEEGFDLPRLLTAFQLGARVAWRHVAAAVLRVALPPESLAPLADSVFVFVNQLSYSAATGYLEAQATDARSRERAREELAERLLTGRVGLPALRAAANRAGWKVPDRAALVLIDPDDRVAREVLDRLANSCLPVRRPGLRGAIVPAPGTSNGRSTLVSQLHGAHAVVGYAVPLDRLQRTVEVTQLLTELRRTGRVAGDPVFADEHLDTIIVWRDPDLVGALRAQVLAPLEELSAGARQRLTETLTSWLRHQGENQPVADDLCVHPQTVRYRLAQLRELYGDALDDPHSRARLFLALQWPAEGPLVAHPHGPVDGPIG